MAKILFVMTGADRWSLTTGAKHYTGYWAAEFTIAYLAFREVGHEVLVATPGGVVPPVDLGSLAPNANGGNDKAQEVAETIKGATVLEKPVALGEISAADVDALYYPGGYGPMEDLAGNADSAALLVDALRADKPTALISHGPAALLATGDDFAGYRVTAFSNAEEDLNGLADRARWLLQDRLTELGVDYRCAEPFAPHVESDRCLHTGQNPASTPDLVAVFLDALSRPGARS
ncbi:type 1 glutamine amidotransferase domain-containing protein [Nocardia coubleae]|uniref:Type 1 glutamine amidotransferase domain-containing protein n=1 Tax=Nocardia coubleae TaxID=356147 RepID=A0A846W4X1_9NOCA|nr:type 1 glutamine amidotransferase domain-containing protein [Nocardia coubleae]NKX88319.1 type 1 glutamine amidotransferase domain-containing protein [Nocardia coubleae]